MNKLLTTTAVALLLSVGPALAIDDDADKYDTQPEASQSESALPSDSGMTSEEAEPGQPQAANEPALPQAGEDSEQDGELPTTSNVSPEAAKEAKVPDEGEPDTSGGAMERSSAPPESGAVKDDKSAADIEPKDDESTE